MNNKKIRIVLIVFAIVLIFIGIMFGLQLNNKQKKESPPGTDSGLSPEEFYDWKTNLSIKIGKIVDNTFNNNYEFDKNGEFNITLYELQTIYNQDLSEFNTETIKCDLQTSTIKIIKIGEGNNKEISLNCTNISE